MGKCHKAKLLYDAAIADHEYRQTLSLQRTNLKMAKDQVAAINDVIAPLMIHKYHSINRYSTFYIKKENPTHQVLQV